MSSPEDIDLLPTVDLCNALKTFLAELVIPASQQEKLFEEVVFFPEKNLADALSELLITKGRVCIIVPSGDHYTQEKEGRTVRSTRWTSIDLVLADRAYFKPSQGAVFGSDKTVGVIAMKDIVQAELAAAPQLKDLRWCALYPTGGAILTLSATEEAKVPGRQAFALSYETPSGQMITPLTVAWPDVR